MASIPTLQRLETVTARGGQLMGSVGAAIGLLFPKCPLCWMVVSGSLISGTVAKGITEIVGVVLFAVGLWRLLRGLRLSWAFVVIITGLCSVLLAAGARMMWRLEIRLIIWFALIAGAILISTLRSSCSNCVENCGQSERKTT